jgi:hypothetical protein
LAAEPVEARMYAWVLVEAREQESWDPIAAELVE